MPIQAALGFVIWVAWALTRAPGVPQALLLLGALVMVPLSVTADRGPSSPVRRLAGRIVLPAAVLLLIAQHLPPGLSAGGLAVPWLGVTGLLALHGLSRLGPRPRHPAAELCVDAAYLFVAVGGGWALLDRLGARPLGYAPLIVLLTAVHFHFAGLALPLLTGLLGRARPRGTPPLLAVGVLVGIPLVAVGLVLSQVTGWTGGEWLASWTLALSGAAVSIHQILEGRRSLRAPTARERLSGALLVGSGGALLVGMFMAAAYGLGRARGHTWPGMIDMFWWHGVVNAVGFSGLGLLARALRPPAVPPPLPLPQRGLYGSSLFIGSGWFDRIGRVDHGLRPPAGQVDSLLDLAWGGFHPERVHPDVRDFYEHTSAYTLWVRARWPTWALPLGHLAVTIGRRLGQLSLPLGAGGAWQPIQARVFAHRRPANPLTPDTRLYERTYADGRPMFMAAYGTSRIGDRAYMCVALPLPGASMISIMRLEDLPERGLRIRSRPFDRIGAEGIFLDTPLMTLRLPLHEDLQLGALEEGFAPGPDPAVPLATIGAIHRFRLLGLPILELDYLIHRLPDDANAAIP